MAPSTARGSRQCSTAGPFSWRQTALPGTAPCQKIRLRAWLARPSQTSAIKSEENAIRRKEGAENRPGRFRSQQHPQPHCPPVSSQLQDTHCPGLALLPSVPAWGTQCW